RAPPNSEASADWSVQPVGNGAMAITVQKQDGAGHVTSLAIMCRQSMPNEIIVQLGVKDNKGWADDVSSLELSPQDFKFAVEGNYDDEFYGKRVVSPVTRSGNGATMALAISKEDLDRMMKAKAVRVRWSIDHADLGLTGELGGTFFMMAAPAVIDLSLKNCESQSVPAETVPLRPDPVKQVATATNVDADAVTTTEKAAEQGDADAQS